MGICENCGERYFKLTKEGNEALKEVGLEEGELEEDELNLCKECQEKLKPKNNNQNPPPNK